MEVSALKGFKSFFTVLEGGGSTLISIGEMDVEGTLGDVDPDKQFRGRKF